MCNAGSHTVLQRIFERTAANQADKVGCIKFIYICLVWKDKVQVNNTLRLTGRRLVPGGERKLYRPARIAFSGFRWGRGGIQGPTVRVGASQAVHHFDADKSSNDHDPSPPHETDGMKEPTSPSHRTPRFIRRHLLSRSTLRKLVALFLIWTIVEAQLIYYRIARAEHEYEAHAVLAKNPPRIYIASLHWNNERILRSNWNKQVVDLARAFGPDNVFVSVYESGSWDGSKGALRQLDHELGKLGVARQITLEKATHADEMAATPTGSGWVNNPDDGTKKLLRRIPFLSKLRNISLQPLRDLAENGTVFDHVLFLGDVVFTVSDVVALLNTNGGHYAAACSLDFSKPPRYYDTFALRDSAGHEHASQTWPYFRSSKSRNAMLYGAPVPVSSCWNGIVAMPTSAFTGTSGGLKFRGIDDTLAEAHLEGSECCLVHADNPASRTRGVFLNPTVRVGYSPEAYLKVHPEGNSWLSTIGIYTGLWKNRFARWFSTPWFKERQVRGRVRQWEQEGENREEPGEFCLINEMQVIVHNGWKHL
ncbi:cryptococcal mannosyltransferase 1-domain-containing protein [Apodospora peruviana]|uniref:Cryptococcal mannosyltransferase 1-domain-containing protein n=1 Tax=Apodospora peruviana TaxID=516989 RepID=A0AAE0I611_9PEZI|nr:cryptococcal mannosyltransferase 1-domain-containing protein [Apodospora peruviana]